MQDNEVDAVISDNRYGLYSGQIPSIIITHQLQVKTGLGVHADKLCQRILYRFINRFSACWVPDNLSNVNFAGALSHPASPPSVPIQYIGPISRFSKCAEQRPYRYNALVILSGPEPQRSIFEELILNQVKGHAKNIAMVRGLPGDRSKMVKSEIQIFDHLPAGKLNKLVCESEIVIARPGYTTIMDLLKLNKKMIVIPTPGQPEQEYLARHLAENHFALSVKQHKFSLSTALEEASRLPFRYINDDMEDYKLAIRNFVTQISSLSATRKHRDFSR